MTLTSYIYAMPDVWARVDNYLQVTAQHHVVLTPHYGVLTAYEVFYFARAARYHKVPLTDFCVLRTIDASHIAASLLDVSVTCLQEDYNIFASDLVARGLRNAFEHWAKECLLPTHSYPQFRANVHGYHVLENESVEATTGALSATRMYVLALYAENLNVGLYDYVEEIETKQLGDILDGI